MRRKISLKHLNCFYHCMHEVLVAHRREDVLEVLLQPVNFGFEVELGSRDWWLGGHAENTFQVPQFNRGVSAQWEDIKLDQLLNIWDEERAIGNYLVFQTEWAFVPYSARYGYNLGDIHGACIFDIDKENQKYFVFDRFCSKAPEIFGADLRGWVDFHLYSQAFTERLRILRYRFENQIPTWSEEFISLLRRSVELMRCSSPQFVPHVQTTEGLRGIEDFAKIIKYFRPAFRLDDHVQFLLSVRWQDNINQAVVGNRYLMLQAIKTTLPPELSLEMTSVAEALEHSIAAWQEVSRVMMMVHENKSTDFDPISERVYRCLEVDEKLIVEMEQFLQTTTLWR